MAKPMEAQAAQSKWRDLRDWLAQVEALGELNRVSGAKVRRRHLRDYRNARSQLGKPVRALR